MKFAPAIVLACDGLRVARSRHRRWRGACARCDRPFGRHHRRLARQFLHRQRDRAVAGADSRALRAARRRLQDRAVWRRQDAPIAGREGRCDPPGLPDGGDARPPRHSGCRTAEARCARKRKNAGATWGAAIADRRRRENSPSRASASPCGATARAPARSAAQRWSRPASPVRCKFAWSIRRRWVRAKDSAHARADSGSPVFEDQQSGAAIVGVVSWSTGANGSGGCGGITGVTPLTLYRDWILQTARQWGFML